MNRLSANRQSWIWFLVGCGGLAFSAALVSCASAADTETSQLWGEGGQRWDRAGRLPDYSYAGYQRGECPLPELSPAANVKDFGAVGDGTTDDTAAFQRALQKAGGKTVLVPPGRYVITDILDFTTSR